MCVISPWCPHDALIPALCSHGLHDVSMSPWYPFFPISLQSEDVRHWDSVALNLGAINIKCSVPVPWTLAPSHTQGRGLAACWVQPMPGGLCKAQGHLGSWKESWEDKCRASCSLTQLLQRKMKAATLCLTLFLHVPPCTHSGVRIRSQWQWLAGDLFLLWCPQFPFFGFSLYPGFLLSGSSWFFLVESLLFECPPLLLLGSHLFPFSESPRVLLLGYLVLFSLDLHCLLSLDPFSFSSLGSLCGNRMLFLH